MEFNLVGGDQGVFGIAEPLTWSRVAHEYVGQCGARNELRLRGGKVKQEKGF